MLPPAIGGFSVNDVCQYSQFWGNAQMGKFLILVFFHLRQLTARGKAGKSSLSEVA